MIIKTFDETLSEVLKQLEKEKLDDVINKPPTIRDEVKDDIEEEYHETQTIYNNIYQEKPNLELVELLKKHETTLENLSLLNINITEIIKEIVKPKNKKYECNIVRDKQGTIKTLNINEL